MFMPTLLRSCNSINPSRLLAPSLPHPPSVPFSPHAGEMAAGRRERRHKTFIDKQLHNETIFALSLTSSLQQKAAALKKRYPPFITDTVEECRQMAVDHPVSLKKNWIFAAGIITIWISVLFLVFHAIINI